MRAEVKRPRRAAHVEEYPRLDTSGVRLASYNFVVVFEELPIGAVLHELARRLLPEHPSPLITEIPDQLLAVIYPERQLQCQFANRRVDVRDGRGVEPGIEPYGTVAINAVDSAKRASGKGIVAYGYNFDVHLPLPGDDPASFLKARFLSDPQKLGRAFDGDVRSVGVKASIQQADRQANFDIEPLADGGRGLIKARVNYHYEGGEPPLDAQALVTQVRERYEEFLAALGRL